MCFSRSLPGKAPSSCVPATRLPVWWDDVYNNGERQSNFTQHARHGSHLSLRPLRHIWKEMRLKTTLTSCTGRHGERQSRATDEHQTQFHLGRALVKIKKYHSLFLCLFLLFFCRYNCIFFPWGVTHTCKHIFIPTETHTHRPKQTIFVSPRLTVSSTHTHSARSWGNDVKRLIYFPNASVSSIFLLFILTSRPRWRMWFDICHLLKHMVRTVSLLPLAMHFSTCYT